MASPETGKQAIEDAFLDSALEQHERFERPADVAAALFADEESEGEPAPAPRARALPRLAAAALLLGALAVVWVIATRKGGESNDESAASQDPVHKPIVHATVYPESLAQLREWLGTATGATVRPAGGVPDGGTAWLPAQVRGEPDPDERTLPWSAAIKDALLASVTKDPAAPLAPNALDVVAIDLPEHRRVELKFNATHGAQLECAFGAFEAAGVVAEAWGPAIEKAAQRALRSRGVLHASMFAGREPGALVDVDALRVFAVDTIRAHDLGPAALAKLPRATVLRRLDLRYSPAAHDAAAFLALRRCTKLRELLLDASRVTREQIVALGESVTLDQLLLMPPDVAHWDWSVSAFAAGVSNAKPGDAMFGDDAVEALCRLTSLDVLAIIGKQISAAGLAKIATLPKLRVLVLSGCTLGGGGAALGGFAKHGTLDTLYLNDVGGLTDEGMAEIARIASLHELYLNGARGVGKGLTAASLLHCASMGKLSRLELAAWLPPGGDVAWERELWREALRSLVRAGHVATLSLAQCPGLTLDDLRPLGDAKGLDLLFLNGTVGRGRGVVVSQDEVNFLWDRIPALTIVTD